MYTGFVKSLLQQLIEKFSTENDGPIFPAPCEAGKFLNVVDQNCLPCPVNTYSNTDGTACIDCPTDKVSGPGSSSIKSCVKG